jgi:hypothetical protein
MSPLVGCVTPLTRKCPPPPPVSQKSSWLIASPSGSLAVNSDETAKTCPALAVMFELLTVTTGGVSILDVPQSQPIASMTRRSLGMTSSATPLLADALWHRFRRRSPSPPHLRGESVEIVQVGVAAIESEK